MNTERIFVIFQTHQKPGKISGMVKKSKRYQYTSYKINLYTIICNTIYTKYIKYECCHVLIVFVNKIIVKFYLIFNIIRTHVIYFVFYLLTAKPHDKTIFYILIFICVLKPFH